MRWIALFEDSPEMMEHRELYGKEHVEYVREHVSEILIGGGLKNNPDDAFVGGLWILNVVSKARAKELVENDPYFNPKYRSYKLLAWGKILEDVSVTL